MQIIRGIFGILAIVGILSALIGIGLLVGTVKPGLSLVRLSMVPTSHTG